MTKPQENWERFKNEVDDVIADFSTIVQLHGLSTSEARLYSTIFLENEALTLDEMSKELKMSKTSMSTGIRTLIDAKLASRVWKKGVRKDLYKAEDNLYKNFTNNVINEWLMTVERNEQSLTNQRTLLEDLLTSTDDKELKQKIESFLKQVDEILQFYRWLKKSYTNMKSDLPNDDMSSHV
jgi:DNA-binding transcriptional regulator GbsR (MarR family)